MMIMVVTLLDSKSAFFSVLLFQKRRALIERNLYI